MDKTHGAYEAPTLDEVGSVEELTLGGLQNKVPSHKADSAWAGGTYGTTS